MASGGIGIAVLAAGSSRRFGDADKLLAPFRGRPLGEHACSAIPREDFSRGWIITARASHACAPYWQAHGFETAVNPRAGEGMGTSVALAALLAIAAQCTGLVIALADMPMVPASHFAALAQRIAQIGSDGLVASQADAALMPPAAFGAGHFARLSQLGGDIGARAILHEGEALACPPEWLIDIDTPEVLARLQNP